MHDDGEDRVSDQSMLTPACMCGVTERRPERFVYARVVRRARKVRVGAPGNGQAVAYANAAARLCSRRGGDDPDDAPGLRVDCKVRIVEADRLTWAAWRDRILGCLGRRWEVPPLDGPAERPHHRSRALSEESARDEPTPRPTSSGCWGVTLTIGVGRVFRYQKTEIPMMSPATARQRRSGSRPARSIRVFVPITTRIRERLWRPAARARSPMPSPATS
jgi:hypothetical protein